MFGGNNSPAQPQLPPTNNSLPSSPAQNDLIPAHTDQYPPTTAAATIPPALSANTPSLPPSSASVSGYYVHTANGTGTAAAGGYRVEPSGMGQIGYAGAIPAGGLHPPSESTSVLDLGAAKGFEWLETLSSAPAVAQSPQVALGVSREGSAAVKSGVNAGVGNDIVSETGEPRGAGRNDEFTTTESLEPSGDDAVGAGDGDGGSNDVNMADPTEDALQNDDGDGGNVDMFDDLVNDTVREAGADEAVITSPVKIAATNVLGGLETSDCADVEPLPPEGVGSEIAVRNSPIPIVSTREGVTVSSPSLPAPEISPLDSNDPLASTMQPNDIATPFIATTGGSYAVTPTPQSPAMMGSFGFRNPGPSIPQQAGTAMGGVTVGPGHSHGPVAGDRSGIAYSPAAQSAYPSGSQAPMFSAPADLPGAPVPDPYSSPNIRPTNYGAAVGSSAVGQYAGPARGFATGQSAMQGMVGYEGFANQHVRPPKRKRTDSGTMPPPFSPATPSNTSNGHNATNLPSPVRRTSFHTPPQNNVSSPVLPPNHFGSPSWSPKPAGVTPTASPAKNSRQSADVSFSALETYQQREKAHDTAYRQQRQAQEQLFQQKKEHINFLREQQKRVEPFELVLSRKRKFRSTKQFSFTEEDLHQVAERKEALVPIRLDLEADGIKLRDTFTWNLHGEEEEEEQEEQDNLVRPEQFAEVLCEDLQLPPAAFVPAIAKSIREQVDDFYQHAPSALDLPDDNTRGNDGVDDGSRDAPELRVVIKLDITVGNSCLEDQFEWDLNCKRNCPETFAEHMTNELGLSADFRTAIAHSIREQVQIYAKSLLLVDHHFDGSAVDDDELEQCFLPPVDPKAILRTPKQRSLFGPFYNAVTDIEIEKMEKDRERDARRKRRQTQRSRRAVALPDREPPKTNRTDILVQAGSSVGQDTPAQPVAVATRKGNAGLGTVGNLRAGNRKTRSMQDLGPPERDLAPAQAQREKPLMRHTPKVNVTAWRCENCGITAANTPLLRKGPSGEKTLCNACGLYWHKNSHHRPVGSPTNVQTTLAPDASDPSQRTESAPPSVKDEPASTPALPPQSDEPKPAIKAAAPLPPSLPPTGRPSFGAIPNLPKVLPPWLVRCRAALMAKYPNDQFEVVTKGKSGDLRLKCFDCPGKLYQPGPEETLQNFEVHLKNRHHRANVNLRLGREGGETPTQTTATPGALPAMSPDVQ
ncbi:SWI/SNF chromatin-remodeling complex subunit [Borealophlyctis nickersoniae]|nr:SWI/SNF chromatin-remodeling complex subunit [Borealophlyctis nickersoniae]